MMLDIWAFRSRRSSSGMSAHVIVGLSAMPVAPETDHAATQHLAERTSSGWLVPVCMAGMGCAYQRLYAAKVGAIKQIK